MATNSNIRSLLTLKEDLRVAVLSTIHMMQSKGANSLEDRSKGTVGRQNKLEQISSSFLS